MKQNFRTIFFSALLVVITVSTKLIFANNIAYSGCTPIFAIALFSGMMVPQKNATFLLPLLALFISDVIIETLFQFNLFAFKGFYNGQLLNYSIVLVTTIIGWLLKGKNYTSIAIGSVAAPTLFFIVSNATVWYGSTIAYTHDANGLLQCYEAGLPFYKNQLITTTLFLPAIMFVWNFLVHQKTKLVIA